jgi:RNA polymerase subunit RPABC4/transcription elongation factor Spt4
MSSSWKGIVVVVDVQSETAKKLNITEPGKYALYVG